MFVINVNFFSNPINSVSWFKDGNRIKDDARKHLAFRNTIKSIADLNKRKKTISVHTTAINPHKQVSKLKIKVRLNQAVCLKLIKQAYD